MGDYPEHEKLHALEGDNDTIGAFLDWLQREGYVVARWGAPYEQLAYVDTRRFSMRQTREWKEVYATRDPVAIGEWLEREQLHDDIKWGLGLLGDALPDPDHPGNDWYVVFTDESRLWPAGEGIEQLLARYFDVDLRKLSDEKKQILDSIRVG